jgi:hypothetical protein
MISIYFKLYFPRRTFNFKNHIIIFKKHEIYISNYVPPLGQAQGILFSF